MPFWIGLMKNRWLKAGGILLGAGVAVAIAALLLNLLAPKISQWNGWGSLWQSVSGAKGNPSPQPTEPAEQFSPNASAVPDKPIALDYTQLKNLLAAQQFKAADRETQRLMHAWADRKQRTGPDLQLELQFPCKELRTIDQLWLQASNGQFGFSLQKEIWQETGQIAQEFGSRVGWHRDKQWLKYNGLNFNREAPLGHLPAAAWNAWEGAETDKDLNLHWFYLVFLNGDRGCEGG